MAGGGCGGGGRCGFCTSRRRSGTGTTRRIGFGIVTGQYDFPPMMRGPINTCHMTMSRPWFIGILQSMYNMMGGTIGSLGTRGGGLSLGGKVGVIGHIIDE